MINISMKHHEYRAYSSSTGCIVAGHGFYKGTVYKEKDFSSLVSGWSTEEVFFREVRELNGFYALILKQGGQLFAAVDRVRSIPLFYGVKGNDFFISDSADWVREQVGNTTFDSLAKDEFLLTGYVTGPDTLFPDVKQLQAGEALIAKEINGQIEVRTCRYYRFVHEYEQTGNLDGLLAQHDEVLVRIFNRLIQVADERTIVVPLSGGLDSRLIVLMLKRLGYENVTTFTYGRPGNKEAEVSRKVAESLGLRWEFVPYSNEDWYRWFNSSERQRYWQFASGFVSLPFIQDWPAVWELKNRRLIPYDIIFVPGHTGDFISGGHIPANFGKSSRVKVDALINAVLKKHYSLFGLEEIPAYSLKVFRDRITDQCETNTLIHTVQAASVFEKWEWQERQAKFIVNWVRVYEFWGYDWWLPLWDYDYMQFWCGVPLEFRFNQTMYKQFVNQLFEETTGYTLPRYYSNPSFKKRLINAVSPHLSTKFKRNIQKLRPARKKEILSEYYEHPHAVWGIYSLEKYLGIREKCSSSNSASVLTLLEEYDEL